DATSRMEAVIGSGSHPATTTATPTATPTADQVRRARRILDGRIARPVDLHVVMNDISPLPGSEPAPGRTQSERSPTHRSADGTPPAVAASRKGEPGSTTLRVSDFDPARGSSQRDRFAVGCGNARRTDRPARRLGTDPLGNRKHRRATPGV